LNTAFFVGEEVENVKMLRRHVSGVAFSLEVNIEIDLTSTSEYDIATNDKTKWRSFKFRQ
jgi:hypothetical protein